MQRLFAHLLGTSRFPSVESADEDGLVAVGGELKPSWLVDAYLHGIFPWPVDNPSVPMLWFSPPERALIEPEDFHISRRLRQTLRSGKFRVTMDTAFRQVIENCANVFRPSEDGTWILPSIIEAYCHFHEMGFAHSVEVWHENRLVGGLYGEAFGSYFAGESMFHLETDASKVALAWLVRHLQSLHFTLIDVQVANNHTLQFNLNIVPRREFLRRLSLAVCDMNTSFTPEITWQKEMF